jgi:hypothetical protein
MMKKVAARLRTPMDAQPQAASSSTEHGGPGAGRVQICQRCPNPNLRTSLVTNPLWRPGLVKLSLPR